MTRLEAERAWRGGISWNTASAGEGRERINAVTDSEILTAFQRFEEGWKWRGLNA